MAERQDEQRVVELRRRDRRDHSEDMTRPVLAGLCENRITRLALGQDSIGIGALDRLEKSLAGGQRLGGRLADGSDFVAVVLIAVAGRSAGHQLVGLTADGRGVVQLLELAFALLLQEQLQTSALA